MNRIRFACVSLAVTLLVSDASWAYLIDNVALVPPIPNTATPIRFDVMMTTPNSAAFLFAPTTKSINGNNISVDVFVDSGLATALDSLTEHVPLGLLPTGAYHYTVTLHPAIDVPFGRGMRVVTGSFQVVPEPSSLWLGLIAASTLIRIRRRR